MNMSPPKYLEIYEGQMSSGNNCILWDASGQAFLSILRQVSDFEIHTIGLGGKKSDQVHMAVWRSVIVGAFSFSCDYHSGPRRQGCLGALGMVEIIFVGGSLELINLDTQSHKRLDFKSLLTSHTSKVPAATSDLSTFFPLSSYKVLFDAISSGGKLRVPLLHCHDIIALQGIHNKEDNI